MLQVKTRDVIGRHLYKYGAHEPVNFHILEQNITQNSASKVTAIEAAIAGKAGTQTLRLYRSTNLSRHSMLAIHEGDTLDVASLRIDDFWRSRKLGNRIPRFIKMDIEGFELMALKGATEVVAKCPMVMLEYSPRYMRTAGINPVVLLDQMVDLGFQPHELYNGQLKVANTGELAGRVKHADLFRLKEIGV